MLYHDIESKFGVGLNGDLVSRIAERVKNWIWNFKTNDFGHPNVDQQVCEHLMANDVVENPDVLTFFDFGTSKCWLRLMVFQIRVYWNRVKLWKTLSVIILHLTWKRDLSIGGTSNSFGSLFSYCDTRLESCLTTMNHDLWWFWP